MKRIIERKKFTAVKVALSRSTSTVDLITIGVRKPSSDAISKITKLNGLPSINENSSLMESNKQGDSLIANAVKALNFTFPSKKEETNYSSVDTFEIPPSYTSDFGTEALDFANEIDLEIKKINKFFVGKLVELQTKMDVIVKRRTNVYRTHHTSSGDSELNNLRDIYLEFISLKEYVNLNETGSFV